MLYKPQVVTVIPSTPGQVGREASYACSDYDSGAPPDGGGVVPPPEDTGSGGSGVRFSGIGTPYEPTSGETVYVDSNGDGLWSETQVTDAEAYTCVYGTSEPIYVNGNTTFVSAPFCTYTG